MPACPRRSSPDVAALLGRLRDRHAAREDVVGVYVYGSLVTGDYSPAASDIDVVVQVQREPGQVTTRELMELHTALAATGARPASCTACTSRPTPRPTPNAWIERNPRYRQLAIPAAG